MPRSSLVALACVSLLTACGDGHIVHVKSGDSARLLAVTSSPRYANYHVVLAPGTYVVNSTITLQTGQRIEGAQTYVDHDGDGVWDPLDATMDPADPNAVYAKAGTETVVDVSGRTSDAAIIVHAGNAISGITVRGAGEVEESDSVNSLVLKFLILDQDPASGTFVLSNCVLEGGYHAFAMYAASSGSLVSEVTGNVFRSNVEGILTGARLANGVTLSGTYGNNRIMNVLGDTLENNAGETVAFSSSSHGTATVTSRGNIIDHLTGSGLSVIAGFVPPPSGETDPDLPNSNGNTVNWVSTNDSIWRNGLTTSAQARGGIFIAGSVDINAGDASSSNNTVNATFTGTRFVKPDSAVQNTIANFAPTNIRCDLYALGGASPFCGVFGSNNHVSLTVSGAISDNDAACAGGACSTVFAFDAYNADTTKGNAVTFTQTETSFDSVNTGLLFSASAPTLGLCDPNTTR